MKLICRTQTLKPWLRILLSSTGKDSNVDFRISLGIVSAYVVQRRRRGSMVETIVFGTFQQLFLRSFSADDKTSDGWSGKVGSQDEHQHPWAAMFFVRVRFAVPNDDILTWRLTDRGGSSTFTREHLVLLVSWLAHARFSLLSALFY